MQEYDVALKLLLRGSAKLTMRELTGAPVEKWLDVELPKVRNTRVDHRAVDIRELDGDRLLESEEIGNNVIAILARLRDQNDAVRRVVEKIAGLVVAGREAALGQLLILAGLRRLEETVEQEARKMPILNDILDNQVLGREFKRGLQEGKLEGKLEGERKVLRRQIEKRFGPIPSWAEEQLASPSAAELEDLIVRVLDAGSLEDLLK